MRRLRTGFAPCELPFRAGTGFVALGIVALAAFLRLGWLQWMEFKSDEGEAFRLALHALGRAEPGIDTGFPTHGLIFSVGIKAPPLFIYLLALPLAIVRTPIAAAALVAATNVVAVWLCYVAGRRFFSERVGLISAGLFAVSPWAIISSRKIWSPDLVPLFTSVFLLALLSYVRNKNSVALFWLVLSAGVATQMHLSAWVLVIVLMLAVVVRRDAFRWRYLLLGVAASVIVYAPYIWDVLFADGLFQYRAEGHADPIAERLLDSGRDTLAIGVADRTSVLFGSQPELAYPFSVAFGTVALAGLAAGCRNWRREGSLNERLLLCLWYGLPLTALTLLPIRPFVHYFIVLYPLPFLGLALLFDRLARSRPLLTWSALAGCFAVFIFFDAQMFRIVAKNGGATGEYGVAYTFKARAVESLVRESRTRRFELSTDARRNEFEVREYRVLEWNERGGTDKELRAARWRYLISTEFDADEPGTPGAMKRFGPLLVTRTDLASRRSRSVR
jgi:4-amino-4-deoxy-L-arabinose transferase-like glycosyltransferase